MHVSYLHLQMLRVYTSLVNFLLKFFFPTAIYSFVKCKYQLANSAYNTKCYTNEHRENTFSFTISLIQMYQVENKIGSFIIFYIMCVVCAGRDLQLLLSAIAIYSSLKTIANGTHGRAWSLPLWSQNSLLWIHYVLNFKFLELFFFLQVFSLYIECYEW